MAVPVSTAPVIKTDRGRSSTRSPVRRRTSVNLETPIPRRGRSASINSSRSWESPEARRKRTKSRGRDRSRSYTPSSSRSGSRDVQKYDKGPYCNSRSRSRSRRGRRAQSRRYSTSPLRSPSWSRSRRSTSSIASSRSRSSSVAQKRGRVENSRSRRKSRSRSSRERKRSRSRSRSRTRSRRTSKRKDRYECQAPSPKATDILKIKEEIKEAQLPRPKARFSRVGTVANTDWPATNSNAQFVIKHFDVPANDVSVQQIVFGQQGRMVAVACSDSTIRLWETKPKIREVTQVSTTSAIVGLCWMDGDSGFLTLGVDCQVALHIQKLDKWHSCKLFNMLSTSATTTDVPTCMVYTTGKIAIATLTGVKVWFLTKGVWQQQRDITRSGVTTLKFLPDGNALVGGCKDGLLWYCEVPNGTLRAYAFMPLRKAITAMDMPASSSHLLVTQEGGSAYLVALRLTENKGVIEKTYTSDKVKAEGTGCGAIFATYGQALVFGSTNGCALVWDRKKGSVVYGLKHPEGMSRLYILLDVIG
ncbi:WD40-repeat-containing domain protein [Crepidotus variabilis]|uniref:WD40-repeat-containing domain protein n=1 Tax=Crepidotus variabilis TaxID=179855 RepID=A0A9P6ER38_9AGAR|nr:WD40-repeat-containing domain protein [Crepidotus variabilis]